MLRDMAEAMRLNMVVWRMAAQNGLKLESAVGRSARNVSSSNSGLGEGAGVGGWRAGRGHGIRVRECNFSVEDGYGRGVEKAR